HHMDVARRVMALPRELAVVPLARAPLAAPVLETSTPAAPKSQANFPTTMEPERREE
ncbi:MAG: hypothetical protein Q9183_006242, partial [Haloplaca sp. 2 TL-2023]